MGQKAKHNKVYYSRRKSRKNILRKMRMKAKLKRELEVCKLYQGEDQLNAHIEVPHDSSADGSYLPMITEGGGYVFEPVCHIKEENVELETPDFSSFEPEIKKEEPASRSFDDFKSKDTPFHFVEVPTTSRKRATNKTNEETNVVKPSCDSNLSKKIGPKCYTARKKVSGSSSNDASGNSSHMNEGADISARTDIPKPSLESCTKFSLSILKKKEERVGTIVAKEMEGMNNFHQTKQQILNNKANSTSKNKPNDFLNAIKHETSRIERKLLVWFNQMRAAGQHVTKKLIQETAIRMKLLLNGAESFQADNEYVDGFLKRHGIQSRCVDENGMNDTEASAQFLTFTLHVKTLFTKHRKLFKLNEHQIYNADESGFLWKVLPSKTLTQGVPYEWDRFKDRVTVMACANLTGTHKLPLFMTGKYPNSSLTNLNMKSMPVQYGYEKHVCMNRYLFLRWYKEVFLPEIIERHGSTGRKCILVLDNAPYHPSAAELNKINDICVVLFLEQNIPVRMQPMNQGVFGKFKRLFRKYLLQDLYSSEYRCEVQRYLSELNFHNCLMFASLAWTDVTKENINDAWIKSAYAETVNRAVEEKEKDIQDIVNIVKNIPELDDISPEDATLWVEHDNVFPGWQIQTIEQIIFGPSASSNVDELKEDHEVETAEIESSQEAAKVTKMLCKWALKHSKVTSEHMSLLLSVQKIVNDVALSDLLTNNM